MDNQILGRQLGDKEAEQATETAIKGNWRSIPARQTAVEQPPRIVTDAPDTKPEHLTSLNTSGATGDLVASTGSANADSIPVNTIDKRPEALGRGTPTPPTAD
ncbi:MAG TPA: hypothetical protein VJJ78_04040 [Candidatus Saccharimonadales bacterium]|nr:hypothetical protein [Candidatus Saccharimonadales bacterium]